MKDKKQKLGFLSENLAVPEIHVDTPKNAMPAEDDEIDSKGEFVYDNLAIPEINLKKFRKAGK